MFCLVLQELKYLECKDTNGGGVVVCGGGVGLSDSNNTQVKLFYIVLNLVVAICGRSYMTPSHYLLTC